MTTEQTVKRIHELESQIESLHASKKELYSKKNKIQNPYKPIIDSIDHTKSTRCPRLVADGIRGILVTFCERLRFIKPIESLELLDVKADSSDTLTFKVRFSTEISESLQTSEIWMDFNPKPKDLSIVSELSNTSLGKELSNRLERCVELGDEISKISSKLAELSAELNTLELSLSDEE
jgi:hypothetical protein